MCTPKQCTRCCKRRVLNCWIGCKTPGCEWAGFCRCPHGRCYTGMAIIGSFMGMVMNLYVVMSCFFHRITEINPITGEVIPSTSLGYGLIARETNFNLGETPSYQKCTIYPPDEQEYLFDWWMTTARNMAFLAGFLGFICWVVLIFSYCFRFTSWTMERWLLWCYLFAALAMAFVMLMWGGAFCKENKCQVAQGTGYVISCFFTHLMMANTVKSMGQPPPRNDMPEPGGREDDYWYEEGDERFPDYNSDEERSVVSEGSAEFEQFEDELENERQKRNARQGKFSNVNDYENDGINEHHEDYDEMTQYMSENAEQKPDDYQDFLDKDEQSYRRSTRDYEQDNNTYYEDDNSRYADDSRYGGDSRYADDSRYGGDSRYEDDTRYGGDSRYEDDSRYGGDSRYEDDSRFTDEDDAYSRQSSRRTEGNMGVGYEDAEEEDRRSGQKLGDHTLI